MPPKLSKKHSTLGCPNPAKNRESNKPQITERKRKAALVIQKFWITRCRPPIRRIHGPALYTPELSHNDKDIYSYEPIQTIPFTYHFSYRDTHLNIWTFDLRFLLQLLHYGKDLKNPYTQEEIPESDLERLYSRSQTLRKQRVSVMYTESQELTPEQLWNQKVLDVFLRLISLGYGVNVLWFETMTSSQHQTFYTYMWNMWNTLTLTNQERMRIVPGYNSQRTPLFRFHPSIIQEQFHDLRWWRKTNLTLMNSFLTRGQDRETQGCGALYILTSMANSHPRAGEAFYWLRD